MCIRDSPNDTHQGERHPQHHPGAHLSDPTSPSHAPRLTALRLPRHPLPDTCGQTAPAPVRHPSDGCTDAAIRCTNGIRGPLQGQTADQSAAVPPPAAAPPAAVVPPGSPPRSFAARPQTGRRPSGAREVARRSALPVHFTRDPVRRVDFARPATGGRTRFVRSPARCECRSVRRARPVPGPSGWKRLGTIGASGVAVTWPPRTTETDPAVGGRPTGNPRGTAAVGP